MQQRRGVEFPDDPREQLWGAIGAVFGSWNNPRAIAYRKLNNIPDDWGTAVTVQAMVFGNMGADSGTGVAFTRDPATGGAISSAETVEQRSGACNPQLSCIITSFKARVPPAVERAAGHYPDHRSTAAQLPAAR